MKYEIYRHGILGQKWGVRRYRNEDGTLTPAGKERYNHDSDNLALLAGNKYRKLANLQRLQPEVKREILRNPKGFQNSKIRQEYLDAYNDVQKAFRTTQTFQELLKTKYEDVNYDFAEEKETGEQYVKAILKTKTGDTYISEYYLGYRVSD